jgi:hypothetical protein
MADPATLRAPPSAIEFHLDQAIPRLFVSIDERATGPGVAEALSRLYTEQPEVTLLDILFELDGYRGVVTHGDMKVIVEAYLKANRDPSRPCRTAFVTPDPLFHFWAAAMSYLFTGREHRVFSSFQAASAWLDEPMGERPPFRGAPVPGLEQG